MTQALLGRDLTAYGEGSQTRSFCFVSDLIRGIVLLSRSSEHLPVNIGNPVEWTIAECAQAVLEVVKSRSEIVHYPLPVDDPTRRCPDISKARAVLGWEPSIEFCEGLRLSREYLVKAIRSEEPSRQITTGDAGKFEPSTALWEAQLSTGEFV